MRDRMGKEPGALGEPGAFGRSEANAGAGGSAGAGAPAKAKAGVVCAACAGAPADASALIPSRAARMLSFIRRNKVFSVFAALATLVVLVAVFAPVVTGGVDPAAGNLTQALLPPSSEHLFGTDKLGRDVFARVIYGARVSLVAAGCVVVLASCAGAVLGVVAGYFRGGVDVVIMRIADMMLSFPGMVLAIAVAGIMGASIQNAVIAISLVTWPKYARLARSLVLKVRESDYVAAAVVTGSKPTHILAAYLLPSALTTLVITAATDIGAMMLELAGLSFLGFGATPPTPEWGLMLSEARTSMTTAPWLMVFPGAAIFVVVAIFNMLGDGLRDILDPKSKEG